MRKLIITGSIVGALLLTAAILGLIWIYRQARTLPPGPGSAQFQSAAAELYSKSELALGNNEKAKEFADRMRNIMENMRTQYFTGAHTTPIAVYCQLNTDSCAFLIYMPGMFRFDSESKQKLAEMAWISAQPILRHISSDQKPTKLAIGLRDAIPFDIVWTGRVTDDPLLDADEKHTGINCRTKLYPFFMSDLEAQQGAAANP